MLTDRERTKTLVQRGESRPSTTMVKCFAAIAALFVACSFAGAAEIVAVNDGCFFFDKCENTIPNAVLIKGQISDGDANKFRSVVKAGNSFLYTVILRSKGGSISEATRIGEDVRQLLLETEGPRLDYYTKDNSLDYDGGDIPICWENGISDYRGSKYKGTECICASACFFVYVAGVRRDRSYVGIHRAYLDPGISRNMDLDSAMQRLNNIKKPIVEYMDRMGVPRRYTDLMFQTSSQELYFPKYPEIMSTFYGWIPEVEEWLIAKCKTVGDRQIQKELNDAFGTKQSMIDFLEKRTRRENCIQDALIEERVRRWHRFNKSN